MLLGATDANANIDRVLPTGQPGDDGRVGVLMDLFEPFGSAHRREVGLHTVWPVCRARE